MLLEALPKKKILLYTILSGLYHKILENTIAEILFFFTQKR